MERNKQRFHVDDYSVSQTTLEQVFINFARGQTNPDEYERDGGKSSSTCCVIS